MHYDAVTHTQRAIRNLQSEVRLFLRKQQEDILPQIIKKPNTMVYKDIPLTVRSTRHRSQFESPVSLESPERRVSNTICFDDIQQQNRVNVVILKPRVKRRSKVKLPSFQKRSPKREQQIQQKQSVQLIQHSLLQPQNTIISKSQDKQELNYIYRQKSRKLSFIPKGHRYSNKTSLEQKEDTSRSKTINVDSTSIPCSNVNRPQCYSPWEMQEDPQLIQISNIYTYG